MILKFRVWDNLKKEWCSNKSIWRMITDNNGIGEVMPPAIYFKQHPEGLTIQQFTGLLDKNGREIYDGDICHAYKANSYLDGNYEVSWHETKGRWYYKNQPEYKDLYQIGCAGNLKCEVIGNILENSELLK
jgi:uncharacterized phage protein (TIGR01671 family)